MPLSSKEIQVMQAAIAGGAMSLIGRCKCASVLQADLKANGQWNEATETAVCCTGYEHPEVGALYETIRDLVKRDYLQNAGDLKLPAGPRYTECGPTAKGIEALSTALS